MLALSQGFDAYKALYDESIANPERFWEGMARKHISWFRDFTEIRGGSFSVGAVRYVLTPCSLRLFSPLFLHLCGIVSPLRFPAAGSLVRIRALDVPNVKLLFRSLWCFVSSAFACSLSQLCCADCPFGSCRVPC